VQFVSEERDETGLIIVQRKSLRWLVKRQKPNMCINFSEERTFGNGHCLHEMFVPPMQIFPRTDMNDQLMQSVLATLQVGCSLVCSLSGFTT
jgi:hypothetical protein